MKKESKPPLAFFITIRTYGTWLHGDKRGSTNRFQNEYRSPHLNPNLGWEVSNRPRLKCPPFKLGKAARNVVQDSIHDTCEKRCWQLHAENVRTNHVHIVVGTDTKRGKKVRAVFKANATRKLRESKNWAYKHSPWAAKGSVKSIWDLNALGSVVDYVLFEQGEDI